MTNPVRFGQDFIGRVANPRDILQYYRKKQAAERSKSIMSLFGRSANTAQRPRLALTFQKAKERTNSRTNLTQQPSRRATAWPRFAWQTLCGSTCRHRVLKC